jgi:hypothetical protein
VKKIKEINTIYTFYYFKYEKVVLPFLDRLYSQWYLNDVGIIKKFLYYYWHCRGGLWNLHTNPPENSKFLYF